MSETAVAQRAALFAACVEMARRLNITERPSPTAQLETYKEYLLAAYKLIKPKEVIKVTAATCEIMRKYVSADIRIRKIAETEDLSTAHKRNVKDWKDGKPSTGRKRPAKRRLCAAGHISLDSYDLTFVAGAIDAMKKLLDERKDKVYINEIVAKAHGNRAERGLPLNLNLQISAASNAIYTLMHIGILDGDSISVWWSTEATRMLREAQQENDNAEE